MRPGPRLLLLSPLAALLACGSSATLPPSSTLSTNFSGNWEVLISPLNSPSTILDFTGDLQSNGSTVTGTFRTLSSTPLGGNCPSITTDLAVSGTLDASNNLTLNIPISGGTATFIATLPQNPQTFTPGNLKIVGGTCSMPATDMFITQFAPVTGTYAGTLATTYGTPAISATVTASLVQSTTPNADGQFPLTGTVTIQGPCSVTLPMIPVLVSGNGIFFTNGSSTFPASDLSGAFMTPTATSIQAFIDIYGTNCPIDTLQGILTRQ
jgi:hypothetical protein